jgi:dipeptidyl aminopeptidase/acylaminoacyl peptidase
LLVATSHAQDLQTVTPDAIANLHAVSDAQISPDGDKVLYVVETPVKAGDHKNAHIWITGADGNGDGRPFLSSAGADTSPRWSPDGQSIAFLSDRENPWTAGTTSAFFRFTITDTGGRKDLEKPKADKVSTQKPQMQIWIASVSGGEALPITDIWGGVKAFEWSKDGERIAFIREDQDPPDERARKEQKRDDYVMDKDFHFARLWIYDRKTQQARLLSKTDYNVDDFDWSPDGSQIVARISPTPTMNDYWYAARIVTIDTNSGAVSKTLTEHSFWMRPQWSPSGKEVAFSVKTSKRIAGNAVVYDLESGKQTVLAAKYPATLWEVQWAPDGKTLVAEGIKGTHAEFLHIAGKSGEVTSATSVIAESGAFTHSLDGKKLAYIGQSMDHPSEVWTYSEAGLKQCSNSNPQVAQWKLGKVREISWSSSKDKCRIYGVLILPWDFEEGKTYKTIVQIHGGPQWAWWAGWLGSWHEWAQLLASHGYAVLLPNPRGSEGQGAAFAEANVGDWGGADFQDVMDGVDELVKEKIADPNRLAIGGWSYGGFMTSWAITHTDRFKAAVVGAPVTDLFSMSTTTDISPAFMDEYFGDFFAHRADYDAHSPMRFIDRCHTPALVLQGDADTRVPTFQGEEFYNGLRLLKRETVMVRYPREPHVFAERDHQSDLLGRVLDWFDSHVK